MFGALATWDALDQDEGDTRAMSHHARFFPWCPSWSPWCHGKHWMYYIWLVVWLPCFIFPYIGLLSSSQLTFIFFKGVETTNQIFNLGIQQLQILSISYAAGDLDCFVSHSSWISMELHRGRRSVVFSVGGGAWVHDKNGGFGEDHRCPKFPLVD